MSPKKVLIVTGSLLSEKETSVYQAIRKQIKQWGASQSAWLDLKVKVVVAELLVKSVCERKAIWGRHKLEPSVQEFFSCTENYDAPELTEVVLATLLEQQDIPYEVLSYSDLFLHPKKAQQCLDETSCVFASSTLLRDLSEVEPLIKMLKRPHNKIVLGGALTGMLGNSWSSMPEIDIVAVGYGEMLIPSLVAWIKSDYQDLQPPEEGRVVKLPNSTVLYSGVPATKDLDFLITPDWGLPRYRHHKMVYYESVRGCPYRCNFCNYPYLFDDTKFRYKSAKKMANDWEYYVKELGAEYITCLDSLFTMPKRRLHEFCNYLIERKINVKWICYARADDLADEKTTELMKRAGAHQVQIGIESGVQQMLDNMDKSCTVEANRQALLNCRQYELTSLVTLIVGFPGETKNTLEETYQFLQQSPPDFYYLATFSTRVAGVPVLNSKNRRRFDLTTSDNLYTVAPYWKHMTMSCSEVGNYVRELNRKIMQEQISLNAGIFYANILQFQPRHREALLAFQQRSVENHPMVEKLFDWLNLWVDRNLQRDVEKWLQTSGSSIEPITKSTTVS